MNSVVTLADRPHITMDVKKQNSNNQAVLENVVSVLMPCSVNNYCTTMLFLWPTDDLPQKSEAYYYTQRHAKIML